MKFIPKPVIRIEPAFEDREAIRTMFARHAPYRAIASYIPDVVVDDATKREAEQSVQPWFRGNWAAGGAPLVEGAEAILHNKQFLEAAKTLFGTSSVFPEFVVVNVNAPMPAGLTHVDIPAFHGATRKQYPLPLLRVMGSSGLFEKWRVIQAGAVAWFYEGTGGSFDYWSNVPSGQGRLSMSPTRKSPLGIRSRAAPIESGDASRPATRAPCPAARSAAPPGPHPTSSSLVPFPIPSRSRIVS